LRVDVRGLGALRFIDDAGALLSPREPFFFLQHHRGRLRGGGLRSGALHLAGWMTRCRRNHPAPSLRRLAAGIHPRPWESHRFPAPSGGTTPEQVAAVMRLRACPSGVQALFSFYGLQCGNALFKLLRFQCLAANFHYAGQGSRLRPVAGRLPPPPAGLRPELG
jgi:hypothetical protein